MGRFWSNTSHLLRVGCDGSGNNLHRKNCLSLNIGQTLFSQICLRFRITKTLLNIESTVAFEILMSIEPCKSLHFILILAAILFDETGFFFGRKSCWSDVRSAYLIKKLNLFIIRSPWWNPPEYQESLLSFLYY